MALHDGIDGLVDGVVVDGWHRRPGAAWRLDESLRIHARAIVIAWPAARQPSRASRAKAGVNHMEKDYWLKFDIMRVTATAERPHGLSYSFTLHAPVSSQSRASSCCLPALNAVTAGSRCRTIARPRAPRADAVYVLHACEKKRKVA